MCDNIPLIKDMMDVYPDIRIEDHVDSKMIDMYNYFSQINKVKVYTDGEIYEYIKFINKTCLGTDSYKHVINYINKDNIKFFESLFDNYDILCELFPLLPYEIALQCDAFNNPIHKLIKEKWIVQNITWIKRYRTDLLEPYVKLKIHREKYYVVGRNVYSNNRKLNLRLDRYIQLEDMVEMSKNGYLDLVKYVVNIVNESCGHKNIKAHFESHKVIMRCICSAICAALENGHIEIVEYFIDFFKSNDVLHLIKIYDDDDDEYENSIVYWFRSSLNNIKSVKFLLGIEELFPYIDENMDLYLKEGLFKSAKNGNIEIMDFVLDNNGGDINDEIRIKLSSDISAELVYNRINEKVDLLTMSSYYGQLTIVEYLIGKGINIDKYGERAIRYASKGGYDMIIIYIIDKLMDVIQINNDKMENIINVILRTGNKGAVDYLIEKYYTFKHISNKTNVCEIITSAYMGGQIKFIREFYEISSIINLLAEPIDIRFIIDFNSENDCIEFMEFITSMNGNKVDILHMWLFQHACIKKGYVRLLMYILKEPHELTEKDMVNNNIINCINGSASEKSCILFIEWMCGKDLEKLDVQKILDCSVKKGYLNLIKYVYGTNVVVNAEFLGEQLLKACISDYFEIMKFLIDKGADVNYKKNSSVYYNGVSKTMTTRCRNFEMMVYMIEKGMDFIYILTVPHRYIIKESREPFIKTIKYIYEKGLVNINSEETFTLFNEACENGMSELVEYFMSKNMEMGARINKSLYTTVCFNHDDIAIMILNSDKYKDFIDGSNKCLIKACKNANTRFVKLLTKYIIVNECDEAALFHSCINEDLESAVHLVENGINFKKYGNKALRLSAKYGLIDIVKYLVEKGADVNVIDSKYYDRDVEAYLREIGANVKIDSDNGNVVYGDGNAYYSEDDFESSDSESSGETDNSDNSDDPGDSNESSDD